MLIVKDPLYPIFDQREITCLQIVCILLSIFINICIALPFTHHGFSQWKKYCLFAILFDMFIISSFSLVRCESCCYFETMSFLSHFINIKDCRELLYIAQNIDERWRTLACESDGFFSTFTFVIDWNLQKWWCTSLSSSDPSEKG